MKNALNKTISGNKYFYVQLVLIATLIFSCSISPACNDDFKFAPDKQFHAGASAIVAAVATFVTDKPWESFGTVVALGAAKEWYDYKHPASHCASAHDFAYDVLGAAIGTYAGYKIKGLYIAPKRDGVLIAYSAEFK
jgi:uncharacterized protein YfiM (DUF2279 family)